MLPVIIGIAVVVSAGWFGVNYNYERCNDNWIKPNISGLEIALRQRLHGQHLVSGMVLKAITGHVQDANPPKALVLSFHGWTGGGKNFVSRIIAEHLFVNGIKSKYVHLFIATLHFPHQSKIDMYKAQIVEWISSNVSQCERSIFIFDEMDKMPAGLIDSVKPFMDFHVEVGRLDYRKVIFLLLSNSGGSAITEVTLDFWRKGIRREEITYKDLDDILQIDSFNEQGGLRRCSLIEKNLIDAFIPFLPLEHQHIKLCIRDTLLEKGYEPKENIINAIANELSYFPEDKQLYSRSGCKRVTQKVNFLMHGK